MENKVSRKDVGEGIGGFTGKTIGGGLGMGLGLVGGPVGVYVGGGLGSILGNQLGKKIGGKIISNPEKPADFKNASHRIGYLGEIYTEPVVQWADALSPIPGTGNYIAYMMNNRKDQKNKHNKIGYSENEKRWLVGLLAPSPLGGIFTPNKINKNK